MTSILFEQRGRVRRERAPASYRPYNQTHVGNIIFLIIKYSTKWAVFRRRRPLFMKAQTAVAAAHGGGAKR